MRKPGPLRFESYTTEGDLRTLQQYLSASSTTYCTIPPIQQYHITSQIRALLETRHPPVETLTSTFRGRKRKIILPLLSSDIQWSTFFSALLYLPIEATISTKSHIAQLFAEEFSVYWEDCLGVKLACYAVDMDMAGLVTGDIKDKIRELAQPATEKLVEETTLVVRKAREREINAQIVPMCRRVKAYRISKGIWNTWRKGPHKKYHDIPEKPTNDESPFADEDESPFWYGPEDGDGMPPRFAVAQPVARRVTRRVTRKR